jgi:SAM-dependent methyltransferase
MRFETLRLLRCSTCKRGKLNPTVADTSVIDHGFLHCDLCRATFPVEDGIPTFLSKSVLRNSSDPSFRQLDDDAQQKVSQREFHDLAYVRLAGNYKRSTYADRGLFAFLLYYQLREVQTLLASRRYAIIANICCGEGFEIEYLSLLGKYIIAADISLTSVRRAVARGQRLGVAVDGICCDAESLPFGDNTCDLVIAHHSLHHLPNPVRGLEEMVRVSNSTIAFFEPARGLMRYLVRVLGIKPSVEESGNKVYEFSFREVRRFCEYHGARLRYLRKSLITGPTIEPSSFVRLDKIGLTPTLCSGISIANFFLGRLVGTKCSVVIDKA